MRVLSIVISSQIYSNSGMPHFSVTKPAFSKSLRVCSLFRVATFSMRRLNSLSNWLWRTASELEFIWCWEALIFFLSCFSPSFFSYILALVSSMIDSKFLLVLADLWEIYGWNVSSLSFSELYSNREVVFFSPLWLMKPDTSAPPELYIVCESLFASYLDLGEIIGFADIVDFCDSSWIWLSSLIIPFRFFSASIMSS